MFVEIKFTTSTLHEFKYKNLITIPTKYISRKKIQTFDWKINRKHSKKTQFNIEKFNRNHLLQITCKLYNCIPCSDDYWIWKTRKFHKLRKTLHSKIDGNLWQYKFKNLTLIVSVSKTIKILIWEVPYLKTHYKINEGTIPLSILSLLYLKWQPICSTNHFKNINFVLHYFM